MSLTAKQKLNKILKQIGQKNPEKFRSIVENVNKVRVAKANNPLLHFKKDRPEQLEFIYSDFDYNIALCGNQWGKSTAMAFRCVEIITGNAEKARHQPDPSRKLMIWVIAESWTVLKNTIQKDILNFLDPKFIKKRETSNAYISALEVELPNKAKSRIQFKVSSEAKKADSQSLEGDRVHYCFVDEGIKPEIFADIQIRVGNCDGQFFQAFTRLPRNMHMAHHLVDLENNRGRFAHLIESGSLKLIHGSTLDNKYLTSKQKQNLQQAAGMNIKTGEIMDEDLYNARIRGIITKPTGSVFFFQDERDGEMYNLFDMKEWVNAYVNEPGRWDLAHDYGQSKPSTWILMWTSRVTGTTWFIDEVYRSGMSNQESVERLYRMLKKWKCYHKVDTCFADKQIRDTARKDLRVDYDVIILEQYKAKIDKETFEPCVPKNLDFVCKQSDKNNRIHTMSMMRELLEEENPLTPGKPYFRFSHLCVETVKEITLLRWNSKETSSSSSSELDTVGEDHSIDPIRYFVNNKVNKALWDTRFEVFQESTSKYRDLRVKNEMSANPVLLI